MNIRTAQRCAAVAQTLYELSDTAFHISFILDGSSIAVIGRNSKKTHPLNFRFPKYGREGGNISGHKYTCSELDASIKLRNLTNLEAHKLELLNIRINRNGDFAPAPPCQACQNLIAYLQFRNIWYMPSIDVIEPFNI